MSIKYDVAIVGGGISGLMLAYKMITSDENKKIVIIERGNSLENRKCPIVDKKVDTCIKCKSCGIMEGMAGAGAFSDGKYNITTEYGGWITEFIEHDEAIKLMEESNKILNRFGAEATTFYPNDELKKECLKYDLHMLQADVRHFGTDNNLKIMGNLIKFLEEKGVRIITRAIVSNVVIKDEFHDAHFVEYDTAPNETYVLSAYNVVFAVGRVGSTFLRDWCTENNIAMSNCQVDVGVRVELPWEVWSHFSQKIYEPKIKYRSKQYNDVTRMFCFNEKGQVVMENSNGIMTVNGHAYSDEAKKSKNSNFALLSTINFTEPFNAPIEYARDIAALSNKISGGNVLVQRFGDLINGQRTDEKRLKQSRTIPTLNATPGDLSLCIPKRQLDNIIETIYALDKVAPGTANYDTLLYGVECKYYSARPVMEDFALDKDKTIFAIGDGAGITRSLAQAAANGLWVGNFILNK